MKAKLRLSECPYCHEWNYLTKTRKSRTFYCGYCGRPYSIRG